MRGSRCEIADSTTTHGDVRVKYFWRNLAVNLVSEGLWGFSIACVSVTTVLAAFLRQLGASSLIIGLLPAVGMCGYALLQIPGAVFFRRFRRRKWPFIASILPVGLGQFAIAAVAHYVAPVFPARAIGLFFAISFAQALWAGFSAPVWPDMLNRMFPPSRRGRAMGLMTSVLSGTGVIGGLYSAVLLNKHPASPAFDTLFFVAGVAMVVNVVLWMPIVEAPLAAPQSPIRVTGAFVTLLGKGSAWRCLIVARWVTELARAPLIFATVLTLSRFGLPASAAGLLTFMLAAGGAAAAPLAGWLGDRRGYKVPMVVSAALLPVSTLAVLLAPHPWVAFAGFFLQGAAPSADFLGAFNLVIESAPEEDKMIYAAVVDTCMLPPRVIGPLVAGVLAQVASPWVALGAAAIVQLLALAVTAGLVVEPRGSEGNGAARSYRSALD